jgi:hypothetical protein
VSGDEQPAEQPRRRRRRASGGITGPDVLVPIPGSPRPAIAMTVLVSAAEQAWIDDLRAASYRLAIARGHIRT